MPSRSDGRTTGETDARRGLATEWLLTNGLGGFAMGTALGVNTRRYHGLLIAATRPPLGRVLAVHSVAARLEIGGRSIDIWSQAFGDPPALHPDEGTVAGFDLDLPHVARWHHRVGDVRVTRTLTLHRGASRITIRYEVEGLDAPGRLLLRPLTPLRGFHDLGPTAPGVPAVQAERDALVVRRGEHALRITSREARAVAGPDWWRGFAYRADAERGQDWREDVFSPGELAMTLAPGAHACAIECAMVAPPAGAVGPPPAADDDADARLRRAADQFVVAREGGTSIIAGYPWFSDWGRDALISLPGLLLATGRHAEARSVLMTFAGCLRNGLLPNCFDDRSDDALYNAADAPLWFVHATAAYARATGDDDLDPLIEAARTIVSAYRAGTAFGIGEDADGLVTSGDGTACVTWMDAQRGGVTFTPRDGKAIEINALWHHAQLVLAPLVERRGAESEAAALRAAAARTAEAIRTEFWWPERACLHDVLVSSGGTWRPTGELRPNQVFAVSLGPSPLDPGQQRAVVDVVERRLLTPYGLRTLDPGDSGYRPRYEGDLMARDAAYHNGTVWPWLIGPFVDAYTATHDAGPRTEQRVREMLAPLLAALDDGCVGQLAEVYDGDAPHRPSGCPAQAWSVAEVLRSNFPFPVDQFSSDSPFGRPTQRETGNGESGTRNGQLINGKRET